MKQLTEPQTAFIRKRLGVFLENLDFIEEMTDHFILDIERQLNEGIDVQTAFLATKSIFGGADGLQKLEKTFVKSFKKGIYNEIGQMYLQTLRKTPQNILLVLLLGCSYYFLFKDLIFQKNDLVTIFTFGTFFVSSAWYTLITWKYTSFEYLFPENTITVAKNAITIVNAITLSYFYFSFIILGDFFDVFFLRILSTFVFCNFILWTYYGTKILNKLNQTKQNYYKSIKLKPSI